MTLVPAGGGEATPFWCLPCGHLGTADAVLNTILFLPLGALLGQLGAGLATVAAAGIGGSTAIELLQTALPGRHPTAGDIVANGLGAVLGLVLWRRLVRGLPSVRTWTALGVAALVAMAAASASSPPPGVLYGQHTPSLGTLDVYDGDVLDARVGGLPVQSGPLEDSDAIRERLGAPAAFSVSFRVGTPPPGWAPLFAIFSADQEEALFVAIRGDDVLVRSRSMAGRLRFAEPSMVVPGGLAGLEPGDTAVVSGRVEQAGFCLETSVLEVCGLGPDPLQGWRLLRRDLGVPVALWTLLSAGVVAFVSASMLLVGRRRTAWMAIAGLSALALALPTLTPLATLRIPALLIGLAAGGLTARVVGGRGPANAGA
ncbi:MAG: VanZ family protein [Gemmatimonadetes bacterium]|nr:VanZ family protein [Gemmatimonadota bacterium]